MTLSNRIFMTFSVVIALMMIRLMIANPGNSVISYMGGAQAFTFMMGLPSKD